MHRGRGVALEVDEAERESHPADAVGDRVVDALQERGAPAFETLDDRELPERTRPVEGWRAERGREVEQLAVGAGRGQRDAAQVVIEVEGGVRTPLGRRDAERRRHHALGQPRDLHERLLDLRAQAAGIWRPIEDREVAEVGSQRGILLDGPHDRFAGRHPGHARRRSG